MNCHGRKLVLLLITVGAALIVLLSACSIGNSEIEQLKSDLELLRSAKSTLEAENTELKTMNTDLQEENEKLQAQNSELETKVKDAEPWFQLSALEKEAEEKRLAEEKAAKEEAERQAAAAAAAEAEKKAKQGYDTGITYNQLSRTPDDYKGEKVKFYGRVVQVIEGSNETQLRVATSGNYDNVVLVYYSSDIVSSRVLEDDYITLYGTSKGLYTYTSTMGGNITIPLIQVDKIDQ